MHIGLFQIILKYLIVTIFESGHFSAFIDVLLIELKVSRFIRLKGYHLEKMLDEYFVGIRYFCVIFKSLKAFVPRKEGISL